MLLALLSVMSPPLAAAMAATQHQVTVTVAVIALIGTLGAAIIAGPMTIILTHLLRTARMATSTSEANHALLLRLEEKFDGHIGWHLDNPHPPQPPYIAPKEFS